MPAQHTSRPSIFESGETIGALRIRVLFRPSYKDSADLVVLVHARQWTYYEQTDSGILRMLPASINSTPRFAVCWLDAKSGQETEAAQW